VTTFTFDFDIGSAAIGAAVVAAAWLRWLEPLRKWQSDAIAALENVSKSESEHRQAAIELYAKCGDAMHSVVDLIRIAKLPKEVGDRCETFAQMLDERVKFLRQMESQNGHEVGPKKSA
jgi:hypothetical protein